MNMSKLLTAPCELLAVLRANVESFAAATDYVCFIADM